MDLRVRSALLPFALAAAVLLLGWHAAPALATTVDPELVAESVTEDGYYVDSSASYFRSDADLDRLRAALGDTGRVGVVVLPAGTPTSTVISHLLQSPNGRATYVILSGTKLQAASTSLGKAQVDKMINKARTMGDSESQVLAFLDLLNPKHLGKLSKGHKSGNVPTASSPESTESAAPDAGSTAAKKTDSGPNVLLYGVGAAVVLLAAVGGLLLWRRKKGDGGPAPEEW